MKTAGPSCLRSSMTWWAGLGATLAIVPCQRSWIGRSNASVYGRMVIPLNSPRKRLDCTQLYNLEIDRLVAFA